MKRFGVFTYGVICYFIFFGTFLYAIGFVGNLFVPKSIDSAPTGPLMQALLINALLLGIFALQHSLMARPFFKRWWTRFVPQPAERSTYVLFSSLALILLFALWQPIGGVIWDVTNPAGKAVLYGLCALGWGIVLVSTCLINHFDLFGLRQVWRHLRGKECRPLHFVTPGLYRYVRHPDLRRFHYRLLGHTDRDRGASILRFAHDSVHSDRSPTRGTRSRDRPRRGLPRVQQAGAEAGAKSGWQFLQI
jgi:protein-S-isoprenylcysteine O-methyltransferase Ste14